VVKVVLRVVENSGQYERLAIVNQGSGEVAIGGWVVYGSKGDERCRALHQAKDLQPKAIPTIASLIKYIV